MMSIYNAPVLTADNVPEYILFFDSIIKASLPDIETALDILFGGYLPNTLSF